jgi:hypothetical protein
VAGKTIRASEIGHFVYCQRAWWYQRSGHPSSNRDKLSAGERWHGRHGRAVLRAGCLRTLGYLALLAALLSAVAALTAQILG